MMQLQSFYNSECIIPTLTEYFNGETYLSVTHQSNNILFDSLLLRICHFSSLVCTSTSAELLERAKNWLPTSRHSNQKPTSAYGGNWQQG